MHTLVPAMVGYTWLILSCLMFVFGLLSRRTEGTLLMLPSHPVVIVWHFVTISCWPLIGQAFSQSGLSLPHDGLLLVEHFLRTMCSWRTHGQYMYLPVLIPTDLHGNEQKCMKLNKTAWKWTKIHGNACKCITIHENTWLCMKMHEHEQTCTTIHESAQKWTEMH